MMHPHRSHCGWFWAWTAAGFGLVLAFVAIFSLGPFLLPFVTLLVGVCACRRAAPATIATGVAVGLLGIAAASAVSLDAFLLTPLATLAIGLSPALPRGLAGTARIVLLAAVVGACAVAAVSAAPAPDTVLAAIPVALVAFALAAVGRLEPRRAARSPAPWPEPPWAARPPCCSRRSPGSWRSRCCAGRPAQRCADRPGASAALAQPGHRPRARRRRLRGRLAGGRAPAMDPIGPRRLGVGRELRPRPLPGARPRPASPPLGHRPGAGDGRSWRRPGHHDRSGDHVRTTASSASGPARASGAATGALSVHRAARPDGDAVHIREVGAIAQHVVARGSPELEAIAVTAQTPMDPGLGG